MAATTAMCTSFKAELAQCLHNFAATVTPTVTTTNTSAALSSVSSLAGIIVGGPITGTGIPASTVVESITGASAITMSKAATASGTVTATITGDVFKMALIKNGMAGTYGAASTNYTNVTGNSDETSGTGYTATGVALTANISPATSGTTAFWSWSTNPSWSAATFSTAACMIYNTSNRGLGSAAGRSVSVHDFGGTQTVSSGTFTVVLPTNDQTNAILRIT